MFLVVCATELELQPFLEQLGSDKEDWMSLVTGVGMVETTLHLTRVLAQQAANIHAVLNFGVGGAYKREGKTGAKLLEICLAEQEVFGDFGVCYPDRIEPLGEHLLPQSMYLLDVELLKKADVSLQEQGFSTHHGNFVTVCGVSASTSRGTMLGKQHDGIIENMEGAAVARVCEEFRLPLLEMRVVSNFVEDRDLKRWKLSEACELAGEAAAIILRELRHP